ncbi:MAG: DUF167 domain-containing protein [Dehalococcoidia bacterium]|nr:DUF167 domain-containing protein [Dehalococcoidia bacterium]
MRNNCSHPSKGVYPPLSPYRKSGVFGGQPSQIPGSSASLRQASGLCHLTHLEGREIATCPNHRTCAAQGPPCRGDGLGGGVITCRVSAAPEKGKANAAVIEAIAHALGVPPSAVEIVRGPQHRRQADDGGRSDSRRDY